MTVNQEFSRDDIMSVESLDSDSKPSDMLWSMSDVKSHFGHQKMWPQFVGVVHNDNTQPDKPHLPAIIWPEQYSYIKLHPTGTAIAPKTSSKIRCAKSDNNGNASSNSKKKKRKRKYSEIESTGIEVVSIENRTAMTAKAEKTAEHHENIDTCDSFIAASKKARMGEGAYELGSMIFSNFTSMVSGWISWTFQWLLEYSDNSDYLNASLPTNAKPSRCRRIQTPQEIGINQIVENKPEIFSSLLNIESSDSQSISKPDGEIQRDPESTSGTQDALKSTPVLPTPFKIPSFIQGLIEMQKRQLNASTSKPQSKMSYTREKTFAALHERGYFIGPGDIYGGEYTLYVNGDPAKSHSTATVRVCPKAEISSKDFLAFSRVQNQVAKSSIFAYPKCDSLDEKSQNLKMSMRNALENLLSRQSTESLVEKPFPVSADNISSDKHSQDEFGIGLIAVHFKGVSSRM